MAVNEGTGYRQRARVNRGLEMVRKRLRSMRSADFVNSELARPSMHLLRGNAKLLRPALVLESAVALGNGVGEFVDLAVAIELLHTSSLLHDDIIDRDSLRRGVATVHKMYGEEAAILAGDALISMAVQESCKYGTDIVDMISRSAMEMCAGEMLDYTYQKAREVPSLKDYVGIAGLKSGTLIATSASAVAKYSRSMMQGKLSSFGMNVGIGFQIRDDIIDSLELDSKNGAVELRKFRPNIVSTIMKHSRLSKESAVREAIRLNNRYIDKASMELENKAGFADMIAYAKTMKLGQLK